MKKSELKVGMEVAVTGGTGQYDQRSDCAARARVMEIGVAYEVPYRGAWGGNTKRTDGVRIQWLEDATNVLFSYKIGKAPGPCRKGTIGIVPTRCIWMLWPELLELRSREAAANRERQKVQAERNAKRKQLYARLRRAGVMSAVVRDHDVTLSPEETIKLLDRFGVE